MTIRVRVTLRIGVCLVGAVVLSAPAEPVSAQGWNPGAREIALGGIGSTESLATKMMEEDAKDRNVVLPFGLFQVFGNVDVFDPDSPEFNPFRAVEYIANPLHYVVGRNDERPGDSLVFDIVNALLQRDLNSYDGIAPAPDEALTGEGLVNPSWGKTFKFARTGAGSYQGVYVGAGPYLTAHTAMTIDPQLREILSNTGDPIYLPNETFFVGHTTTVQAAAAITIGYRVKVGAGSRTAARDGLYLGFNYRYLWGFWYSDLPDPNGLAVRLDTNGTGLLTIPPCALPLPFGTNPPCTPLSITWNNATSGRGRAIDIGIGGISGPWEIGFGISGIGNYIEWNDVEQTVYTHRNLFFGGDFNESPKTEVGTVRLEVPVDYRVDVDYRPGEWGTFVEWAEGFNGQSLRFGGERLFGPLAARAGLSRVRDQWHPSAGAGIEMSRNVWLDVALFGWSANFSRERDLALAFSIRFAADR